MGKELFLDAGRDDVRRRLVGSICRFRDQPIYVTDNNAHIVSFFYLSDTRQRTSVVDYRDAEFDYRSPPLGYMNYGSSAYYLGRLPSRNNASQGLRAETIVTSEGARTPAFAEACMGNCITGTHPTFQEAMAKLAEEDDLRSIAISRHVALARLTRVNLSVHYRGRMVGIQEGGVWRLLQAGESSILERYIRKAGVPIL